MSNEKLTKQEEDVLAALSYDAEYCMNYHGLEIDTKLPRKYLEPIVKHLKELGFLEFYRGLMTEEGEVAGSGWCRSKLGNQYVEEHNI